MITNYITLFDLKALGNVSKILEMKLVVIIRTLYILTLLAGVYYTAAELQNLNF